MHVGLVGGLRVADPGQVHLKLSELVNGARDRPFQIEPATGE